ncbi:NAD(P)-dependent dehydrogenase (short-subunit alcohol dehydrogenase family) [Prosthecobacter fusiformis]|uniref:NAD(P)-dependent dehydrogenase (Short-subunit alcohol dehydrogenase family) n=1 Tax=Prosthecobacter fusiformis TaxID=48464 RepID=A0A4R7ST41_9BACT|nr:SDR family oxidoreductase [Prosthecobacter fusiformis]TDU81869.1 NAD(P)-dependent dehydrogenase (short-subunit alcohol dehydrogenase family) [Prosthecobacter fusiformis]
MNAKKLVLITGCSRGLGRAMIPEFVQRGWTVIGCARDAAIISTLQQQFPAPHHFAVCDVADDAQVQTFCQNLLTTSGTPDLVLNNAAIVNASAPLWEISAGEFSRIVDINIKGPASIMRHLLPAMLTRSSCVIVNFSSGWGRSTAPEVAPYCATKYAIEGLSQAVAQETGGKVAIIPLNPGIIDTRMLRSCFGDDASHYPAPEEWARTAVPFLIKLGPQHNGHPLTAPGG